MENFLKDYKTYISLINERLKKIISLQGNDVNTLTTQAMKYSLNIGGKRIRPILTLEFCKLCGGCIYKALDVACAIEMVHTYSLIHDDLPCMDNDEIRRGYPSCHVKFGQAVALLAGDALLTEAFNIIANSVFEDSIKIEVIKQLSCASGYVGMVAGQTMDIEYEKNNVDIDIDTLYRINSLKTGRLIEASAVIGCIIAGGTRDQIVTAKRYASNVGIAFQIKDDILDVVGQESAMGKPIGSDKKNKKTTYLNLIGLQNCQKKIEKLSNQAIESISLNYNYKTEFIKELALFLLNRES